MLRADRNKTNVHNSPCDKIVFVGGCIYLGIDPGLSGALAFFNPMNSTLKVLDMPTRKVVRAGKTKRNINAIALGNAIDLFTAGHDVRAYVEHVGAMPGQGVTSMFTFGRGAGVIDGVLGANMIEPVYVVPRKWQAFVGLTGARDKAAHRAKAALLFPANASEFARVKDDGRADAALIAFYASQQRAN